MGRGGKKRAGDLLILKVEFGTRNGAAADYFHRLCLGIPDRMRVNREKRHREGGNGHPLFPLIALSLCE